MAQRFQARIRTGSGDTFPFVAASDLVNGQVVVIDGILGVVDADYASGKLASARKSGRADFVKVNGAISRGAVVYWDEDGNPQGGTAGTGAATTTDTDNTPIGLVIEAAGATDETVHVLMFNAPSVTNTTTSVGPDTNEIADPGDGEAIPVTASGTVMIVTGGSGETGTLADPTFVGQRLTLTMLTDGGGDRVITAASPVNQTGNNTLTFGAVRDTIVLQAIEAAASLEWQVVANDGVALSTV